MNHRFVIAVCLRTTSARNFPRDNIARVPFHLKERSLSLLFPRLFNFFGEKRRENAACAATRCVLSPFPPRLATSRLDAYPGGPVASSGQWAGSDDVSWANGRRGGASLENDTIFFVRRGHAWSRSYFRGINNPVQSNDWSGSSSDADDTYKI